MSFAAIQVVYTSVMTIVDYVTFDIKCNETFFFGDGNESTVVCYSLADFKEMTAPCMAGSTGPVIGLDTILICSITIGLYPFVHSNIHQLIFSVT